jgi:hypothetical protein
LSSKNFPDFAPGTGSGMRRVGFPFPFNVLRSHGLAQSFQEKAAGGTPFPSCIDLEASSDNREAAAEVPHAVPAQIFSHGSFSGD